MGHIWFRNLGALVYTKNIPKMVTQFFLQLSHITSFIFILVYPVMAPFCRQPTFLVGLSQEIYMFFNNRGAARKYPYIRLNGR